MPKIPSYHKEDKGENTEGWGSVKMKRLEDEADIVSSGHLPSLICQLMGARSNSRSWLALICRASIRCLKSCC